MSEPEPENTPQTWDSALLAADLRIRFIAAYAKLREAQIILSHRDHVSVSVLDLDVILDQAEYEIWAALEELSGNVPWEQSSGTTLNHRAIDRKVVPSTPLPEVNLRPKPPSVEEFGKPVSPWPEGYEIYTRREIVALLSIGKNIREIADIIGAADTTVQKRLGHAYRKFGVNNPPHLIDHAWRAGLMDMPEMVALQQSYGSAAPPAPDVPWPTGPHQRLLSLIAGGHGTFYAARLLGISEDGVRKRLTGVRLAMNMPGATHAALIHRAWQLGWLPGEDPTDA